MSATNPLAFPTDAILERTRIPQSPVVLDVRVSPDLAARLRMMGAAGERIGEVVSDAAREGVRQAFDSWVSTLPAENQQRAREAAERADADIAEQVATRLRMLEDRRRNEAFRRELAEKLAIENAPAPKTPDQQLAEAAMPWVSATAGTGWTGDFVGFHREAVIGAMGGIPLAWPYQPLPEDGPFMADVRRILELDPDATLTPEQAEQVRNVVRLTATGIAAGSRSGPSVSIASGYVGRGR